MEEEEAEAGEEIRRYNGHMDNDVSLDIGRVEKDFELLKEIAEKVASKI